MPGPTKCRIDRPAWSLNTVGALQRPHIGDDTGDLGLGDAFHRRHVAKAPVVRSNAELGRHKKGLITVMAGLIDSMDERRRNAVLPRGIDAMTGRTSGIVCSLASPFVGTEARYHDGHKWRTASSRCRRLVNGQIDGQGCNDDRACNQ
jgi:hypothetical protein